MPSNGVLAAPEAHAAPERRGEALGELSRRGDAARLPPPAWLPVTPPTELDVAAAALGRVPRGLPRGLSARGAMMVIGEPLTCHIWRCSRE